MEETDDGVGRPVYDVKLGVGKTLKGLKGESVMGYDADVEGELFELPPRTPAQRIDSHTLCE